VELPWLGQARALLCTYLAGQAGAAAAADILTGAVNPAGKLAETWPLSAKDCPAAAQFPGDQATVEYRESVFVGYRYYDTFGKKVRFPFGFGLSYTSFQYESLLLSAAELPENETLLATCKVTNTGQRAGAEIVQLYVADKESTLFRPQKELKAFQKVWLAPGETAELSFKLDRRAFAFYHTALSDWHVESGMFDVLVGGSSANVPLCAAVRVLSANEAVPAPDYRAAAPDYYTGDPAHVPKEQFEAVLGRPLPPSRRDPSAKLTMESCLEDARYTRWGGRMYALILFVFNKLVRGPEASLLRSAALYTPIRNMVAMSAGAFDAKAAEELLKILNDEKGGVRGLAACLPRILKNLGRALGNI
jgi:beta-glucosidase